MARAKSGGIVISVVAEILQKEIATSRALNATDHKYTIFLTNAAAMSITLDLGLPDNFEADFVQKGAGTTTFIDGTATVTAPDGLRLTGVGNVCAVVKRLANDDLFLLGELIV